MNVMVKVMCFVKDCCDCQARIECKEMRRKGADLRCYRPDAHDQDIRQDQQVVGSSQYCNFLSFVCISFVCMSSRNRMSTFLWCFMLGQIVLLYSAHRFLHIFVLVCLTHKVCLMFQEIPEYCKQCCPLLSCVLIFQMHLLTNKLT